MTATTTHLGTPPRPKEPAETGDKNSFHRTKIWIAFWICVGLVIAVISEVMAAS